MVEDKKMRLELRCVDIYHKAHGEKVELAWRTNTSSRSLTPKLEIRNPKFQTNSKFEFGTATARAEY